MSVPLDIQLNIDPKQIEQMVANAVLESAIGGIIKEEINKVVKGLSYSDGPIRRAIGAEVSGIVMLVVRDEYGEKIREAVRAHLTDAMVYEVTSKAMQAFIDAR